MHTVQQWRKTGDRCQGYASVLCDGGRLAFSKVIGLRTDTGPMVSTTAKWQSTPWRQDRTTQIGLSERMAVVLAKSRKPLILKPSMGTSE